MASETHQRLLNSLARALEQDGIKITHIDIDGDPQFFDEKYRDLPTPGERNGHVPDLEGIKNNLRHLGEVKKVIKGDENLESQFKVFSSRTMNDTPMPLHIGVPKSLKEELRQKLHDIGLGDKLDNGRIKIWS